LTKINLA